MQVEIIRLGSLDSVRRRPFKERRWVWETERVCVRYRVVVHVRRKRDIECTNFFQCCQEIQIQSSKKPSQRTTYSIDQTNVYWRGEAKRDNIFSAPSLYFFSFFVLVFSGSSARDDRDGRFDASGVLGPFGAPLSASPLTD